jgi:hypothetical protein
MKLQDEHDHFLKCVPDLFNSCTITKVSVDGLAQVEYEHFKKALFPISTIIFYEHGDKYYYPLAMEFRLIDNNILYLTEELGVNSAEELFRILTSSMNKEEKWSNEFKLCVVHTKSKPRYCFELKEDFNISNVNLEHVYE